MTNTEGQTPTALDPHPHTTGVALTRSLLHTAPLKDKTVEVIIDWLKTCGTHLTANQIDLIWGDTIALGRQGAQIRNAIRAVTGTTRWL